MKDLLLILGVVVSAHLASNMIGKFNNTVVKKDVYCPHGQEGVAFIQDTPFIIIRKPDYGLIKKNGETIDTAREHEMFPCNDGEIIRDVDYIFTKHPNDMGLIDSKGVHLSVYHTSDRILKGKGERTSYNRLIDIYHKAKKNGQTIILSNKVTSFKIPGLADSNYYRNAFYINSVETGALIFSCDKKLTSCSSSYIHPNLKKAVQVKVIGKESIPNNWAVFTLNINSAFEEISRLGKDKLLEDKDIK